MKKEKIVLSLNKETVANLNSDEMNDVKAGGGLIPTISRVCDISLQCSFAVCETRNFNKSCGICRSKQICTAISECMCYE